jgi:O-antigen/teichoic acid export membrane protein
MITQLRNSKAAHNFGWLVADRGVRLMVGVVVGSWVARYLGKQDFGLLSYSLALVSIFAALTPMGMEALVVREIIMDPRRGGKWLGTVIGFRAMAAVVASLLALSLAVGLRPGDTRAWTMVCTLSVGTMFQALESGELWFQAHTQMRRLVLPRLLLFTVMSVLKITALLTASEQIVSGGITWVIVRHSLGRDNRLTFIPALGWKVLQKCWPLAISALAVILYMKVSQLVLSGMAGDAALGIYAAAIKLPEVATFLPGVLASSLLPWLMRSRAEGKQAYGAALQKFFRINTLMALSITVPVSIAAPWIIHTLYGAGYSEAGPVLAVYVWALPFLFLGVARGQHLLNELMTQFPLWFSVAGLAVNLVACLVLIPRLGPMGAAMATVISYMAAAFLSSFVHPKTRDVGRKQLLAMLTPWKLRTVANLSDGF